MENDALSDVFTGDMGCEEPFWKIVLIPLTKTKETICDSCVSLCMAKKRGRLDFKNESAEVVLRFKKEKIMWKRERLQTIKLLLETDQSYRQVAEIVGRDPSRVKEWAKQFRLGGIDQLLTRGNGGGRKSLLPPQAAEELTEKLRAGTFRTAGQVSHWLKEQYNLEYKGGSIYYVLGKLGGRLKVPPSEPREKNRSKGRRL